MVFRGKPSPSCFACRTRRIKCDRLPSGCGSCRRAGIICTGYRKIPQNAICDETSVVIAKNGSPKDRGKAVAANREVKERLDVFSEMPGMLYPDQWTWTESIAFSVFYRHYECMPGMITDACANDSKSAVALCVKAIGLATLAKIEYRASIDSAARQNYAFALKKVNEALASADCARSDDTLLCVLMLTYFETLVEKDHQPSSAWSAHVRGMASLLAVRGAGQFQTQTGRLLFMQSSLTFLCSRRSGLRIPDVIQSLLKDRMENLGYEDPERLIWEVHRLRIHIACMYDDIQSGRVADPAFAIERSLSLDQEVVNAFTEMIELRAQQGDDIHGEWAGSEIWTSMRAGRVILHLFVIKLIHMYTGTAATDEDFVPNTRLQNSMKILEELRRSLVFASSEEHVTTKSSLSNIPSAEKKLHQLFGSDLYAGNDGSTSLKDRILISSLCGMESPVLSARQSTIFDTKPDGCIALLLACRISNPGLHFRGSASETFRRLGKSLDIPEGVALANAV